VTSLLTACAGVRVLATSRESLGVDGETVWRLEPLDPSEARRLFVERARQRRPDYLPGEEADATIDRLCARLDHLPLAIELAAARVSVMSEAEVLADLETRLGTLGGGGRLAPPHHRTVEATVAWSHQLLDPAEQEAFADLAVFAGSFDAAGAAAVAPGLDIGLLARLVDKSLVAVLRTAGGRTRYRLLETVREYALGRLAEAGRLDAARDPPPAPLLGARRAGARGVAGDRGAAPGQRARRRGRERPRRARVGGGLRPVLGSAAARWCARPLLPLRPGRRPPPGPPAARALPGARRARAEALITVGQLANTLGDFGAATAALAEARDLVAQLDEPALAAWVCFFDGLAETLGGDFRGRAAHLQESLARCRALGIRRGEARSLSVLGSSYVMSGEKAAARPLLEEGLAICVADGDRWGQGHAHTFLGMVDEAAGDAAGATGALPGGRGAVAPVARRDGAAGRTRGPGGPAGPPGAADALRVAAAAASVRARVGGEFAPFYRVRLERVRAAATAAAGDGDGARRLWAEGSALRMDDAAALAFGTRQSRPASSCGLSAREQEVARLVARGLSNKAIAAAAAPLRSHRREPCPSRPGQGGAGQPHAAGDVGARAALSGRSAIALMTLGARGAIVRGGHHPTKGAHHGHRAHLRAPHRRPGGLRARHGARAQHRPRAARGRGGWSSADRPSRAGASSPSGTPGRTSTGSSPSGCGRPTRPRACRWTTGSATYFESTPRRRGPHRRAAAGLGAQASRPAPSRGSPPAATSSHRR
jgi:non-specific serine/threonine protein kinase